MFNYQTVIALAERIKDEENIVIQIVGDGNVKSEFEREAQQRNLHNIVFYPLQPVELVPDVYSACNVCMIPLQRGVIGNGIPSKAPILMACRRVIINSVELHSEYAKSFAENDMGISVEIEDYDGLADAVVQLSKSSDRIEQMANHAQAYGRAHFSSETSIASLIRVLTDAAKSKGGN